jgi:hypothetical protein
MYYHHVCPFEAVVAVAVGIAAVVAYGWMYSITMICLNTDDDCTQMTMLMTFHH